MRISTIHYPLSTIHYPLFLIQAIIPAVFSASDKRQRPVLSVAYSPDGRTLASGSSDNTIKLWDAKSGQELATLKGHGNVVYSVAFSRNGRTLVSANQVKTIGLWRGATDEEVARQRNK